VLAAFRRVDAADALHRAGRLGVAWAGYLDVLREFPTWWLPTIRAAAVARALHQPPDASRAMADRAAALSPEGSHVRLVRDLMEMEDRGTLPTTDGYPAGDPALDRVALVRARALSAAGRHDESAREYRAILERRPGCAPAAWGLARALRAAGRVEEAESAIREGAANSLFPASWRARGRLPAGGAK
jgi:tetratricopeptide (TPR) repeat protein